MTTNRKTQKSDLSPRFHRKGVSLSIEKSPVRKPRTIDSDKTVKVGKRGKNYRHFLSTDRTESLSPDRRKRVVHLRRKEKEHSDSEDSSSSSETDSERESPVNVRPFKHILKQPKFDGVRSFKRFWAQFRNCVERNG